MYRAAALLLLCFPAGAEDPDQAIEKAREATDAFLEHLPNYVCLEVMTRLTASFRTAKWHAEDVVTTDLVLEDGQETYRDVKLNGKPTGRGIEALPGSWSMGEFASELAQIFSPLTAADFRFRGPARLAKRDTLVYDFSVRRPRSQWLINGGSGPIAPAYHGAIWIDLETWRVLRIEKQTENFPAGFPFDAVETSMQYEFTHLSTEEVLLPARSESVACQRNVYHCIRNVIEFQNYRKFMGESTITFAP